MTEVAKHLYFFLVKRYHEGLKSGKWEKWHEERDFPRHEFEDHSSRDDDGVFDGFDFAKWAEQELNGGLEGVKAVEVVGGSKKKMMMWEAHLCGSGLGKSIKDAIEDHLVAQGAMPAAECNKKKVNIWNEITVFLQQKQMFWRDGQGGSIFSGPARSNRR